MKNTTGTTNTEGARVAEVSIIVTTYNIESYIEQCLRSVAEQTVLDVEVLVVDDGSSDTTPAKIIEFCRRHSRFVPVLLAQNSPGGVATAANAGLDRATGRWVCFVDGDDYVEPTMFERLVNAADQAGAELAICDYQEVVDATAERRDPADAHRWAELTESHYLLDVQLRRQFLRFIAVPWRKLYRRDFLEANQIRFPVSDGFYEDNPFHWFAVLSAKSIAVVPEVLCYHRVGRAGQTMATADERLFQIFAHHATIHAWLAGRQLLEVYQSALLGWVISQLEWISRRTPATLRRRLFDTVVPIFAAYSPSTVATALRENNKGVTAQRLSAAVSKREYGSFVRALTTRPGSNNPVVSAAFHVRHSGLRHTTVLVGRYVQNSLQGSKIQRKVGRVARAARDPKTQDVMFALMVIQQRLRGLEGQLQTTQDRLAAIQSQLPGQDEIPQPTPETSGLDEQGRYVVTGLDRLEDPVGRR